MNRLDESVYYSPDSDSESESASYKKSPALSFVPNYILSECLIDLEMFNKLMPGTWVQALDSKDQKKVIHFEPFGGTYSCFKGAQFALSYFKEWTPELFLKDFQKFVKNVAKALAKVTSEGCETENVEIKQKCFNEIHLVGNALKRALSDDVVDGGLYGLLKTHQKDRIYRELKESIRHLKEIVEGKVDSSRFWYETDFTKSQISGNSNKLPYWPEKKFTDDEWKNAMKTSAKLAPESASIEKQLQYWTSSVANTMSNVNLWNQILELPKKGRLILGPMPIMKHFFGQEIRNDLRALQLLNVSAVLSATEVFKTHSSGLLTAPVNSLQWKKAEIKHLQIPISDNQPIPMERILRGVEFIHWCLSKNETVFVHCQDDMNSSALIVMCYLILYHNFTADKALTYVQERCPQAPIKNSFGNLTKLYEFEEKFRLSWNCF